MLARGIDVPQVNYVVNFDLPDFPDDYIHRIGRTGRAGETGFAVSFVSPESVSALRQIQRLIHTELPLLALETVQVDADILEEHPDRLFAGKRADGRAGGRSDGRADHTRMRFTRASEEPVALRERGGKRVRAAAYKERNTQGGAGQKSDGKSGARGAKGANGRNGNGPRNPKGAKPKNARMTSTGTKGTRAKHAAPHAPRAAKQKTTQRQRKQQRHR